MAERNNNGEITFEIMERGGALEMANDNGWRLEVNLVAWNGGKPRSISVHGHLIIRG